jgi:hypothetical protein
MTTAEMLLCGRLHRYFFGDLNNIRTEGENSQTKKVLTKPPFQCAALVAFVYVYGG